MNIYFAAAMRGGRDNQPVNRAIVEHLIKLGHGILTTHVTEDGVEQGERDLTDHEIYTRDMRLLEQADLLIAEVTTPSLGVGFEINEALHRGVPVLCLYRTDLLRRISAFIGGNANPLMTVIGYSENTWLRPLENALLGAAKTVKPEVRDRATEIEPPDDGGSTSGTNIT